MRADQVLRRALAGGKLSKRIERLHHLHVRVQLHAQLPAEVVERLEVRRIRRIGVVRAALQIMLGRRTGDVAGGLDRGKPRDQHFVALRLRVLQLRRGLLDARIERPRPLLHLAEPKTGREQERERDHSFV